jgi:addiction module RelB/DinJ family antitoxin
MLESDSKGGIQMANSSILQVRTDPKDREKAAKILDSLGTNLSAVVNMLLKQIIITEGIPFDVKLNHPAYSNEQSVQETKATLAMEGMNLTEEETRMLTDYSEGKITGDELRKMIFSSIIPADRGEGAEAVNE